MYDRAHCESFQTVAVVRISLLVHSFTNALKDIFAFLESNGFVDAFRACRFLCNLIAFPGIREEIARVGGWEMAESHARKILQYDLMKWCPKDAHLVVLSDADHFFWRVEKYKTAMESSIANCEQSLEPCESDSLAVRLCHVLGTKMQLFPLLTVVDVLLASMSRAPP